jgi:galactokinase
VGESVIAFAPGRVNLIGEHTDYNQGRALPFAIAGGVTVSARRAAGATIEAIALDLDARERFPIAQPPRARGWRAFVSGAVAELQRVGVRVPGARLEFSGTVPRGAGLSSSAALEVALCLALTALSDSPPVKPLELAALCSRIENEWVGAETGLLDQIASICGEPERALEIDFRSLEVRRVTLELEGYSLVTLDSGERHSIAQSGYNERRGECRLACEALGIESLREATLEMTGGLAEPLASRARHVVSENERVVKAASALQRGDLPELGRLLDASHASLRDDYAVSTAAVEDTVRRLRDAGALGARIVGGGFGGNVLGLLPPGAPAPEGAVAVRPSAGAHLLESAE